MKYVLGIIIFIHGLIHILGFVKGFGIKDIKELTLPITKPMGLLWLTAAVLITSYGILHFTGTKHAWLWGFIAALVSQILIIIFWKDAKFGTLPNVTILVVSLISYGHFNFQKLTQRETEAILNKSIISKERIVSESDIDKLPLSVKKWLRNSGAIGKPFISIGKVWQKAEMQMKPDQDNWMTASAIQYTSIDNPAFIWTVDAKMNGLLNFQGRDKFENGKGEMLIKLNSLINVVNEQGEKINEGTIQRYLGEMAWFPSLALSHYIIWEEINDSTATATMNYKGSRGSGTFYFNTKGDLVKYCALRFKDNEPTAKRYEWVLLVDEHKTFEGIKVPHRMTATWKLEKKDWTWLKLEVVDIKFNENAIK